MRQGEILVAQDKVAIGEDVDIDGTGPPPPPGGAVATERGLDGESAGEQVAGRQRGLDLQAEVHEAGWSVTPQGGVS